jgi:uncharacterized protein
LCFKDNNMPSPRQTVAVIGASADRSKFSNKAVRAYRDEGWDVYPVNPTQNEVEGIPAYPTLAAVPVDQIDRVSFYVPPSVGLKIIEQLPNKSIGAVWLNPGSESPELVAQAEALGLNVIQACSIVAIGRRPSEYGGSA